METLAAHLQWSSWDESDPSRSDPSRSEAGEGQAVVTTWHSATFDLAGLGSDLAGRGSDLARRGSEALEASEATSARVDHVGAGHVGTGHMGAGRVGTGHMGAGHVSTGRVLLLDLLGMESGSVWVNGFQIANYNLAAANCSVERMPRCGASPVAESEP